MTTGQTCAKGVGTEGRSVLVVFGQIAQNSGFIVSLPSGDPSPSVRP